MDQVRAALAALDVALAAESRVVSGSAAIHAAVREVLAALAAVVADAAQDAAAQDEGGNI